MSKHRRNGINNQCEGKSIVFFVVFCFFFKLKEKHTHTLDQKPSAEWGVASYAPTCETFEMPLAFIPL